MLNSTKQHSDIQPPLDVFETSIGWVVVQHVAGQIQRIKFGFENRADALGAFPESNIQPISIGLNGTPANADSSSSHPVGATAIWRDALIAYGEGRDVSFDALELDTDWMTTFQHSVLTACRSIPRGQTVTYGELAVLANSPGAAQAAGTVMKTNRFPIVIPCHRVVAASGLGGYSASSGVDAKRKLLEMEGAMALSKNLPVFD